MKCDNCNNEFIEDDLKEVVITGEKQNFYRFLCEECLEKHQEKRLELIEKNEKFVFLDQLRNSGETNMFGAVPYLQARFGLLYNEAKDVLVEWMETFDERLDAGRVSTKVLRVRSRTVIEFD